MGRNPRNCYWNFVEEVGNVGMATPPPAGAPFIGQRGTPPPGDEPQRPNRHLSPLVATVAGRR